MTERIYYDDAYTRDFDATITRADTRESGQALWLDRSAFYPTSGGQPFDLGTLGGFPVVGVTDDEGEVVHLVEGAPALTAGQRLSGSIHWPRRFDHMQQHTGQHILSAAFVRALNVPTVSFHLGTELSTIDLAREVGASDIAKAETLANSVVWENRPVTVSYADSGDAAALSLRKPSQRSGTLRLIDVKDFDRSACGGTHVKATGEIGMISVAGAERFKGGSRLEFACGERALARLRLLRDSLASGVKLLSVLPQEVPAAIERLQAELREQKRALAAANEALAEAHAERLVATAESIGSARGVFTIVDGDVQTLRSLASSLTQQPGMFVILVAGGPAPVACVARSRDLSFACDAIIKSGIGRFGGKGGGRPDMAQAGGFAGAPEEILAHLRAAAGA